MKSAKNIIIKATKALVILVLVFTCACQMTTMSSGAGDPTVTIRGAVVVGATLEAIVTGAGGLGTPSFQWCRLVSGIPVDIPGAMNKLYVVDIGDDGFEITVKVKFSLDPLMEIISDATGVVVTSIYPPFTATITINGLQSYNENLIATVIPSGAFGTPLYQWKRGDTSSSVVNSIAGAESLTYRTTGDDIGKYIAFVVGYTEHSNEEISNVIGPITANLTGAVTISESGGTITANTSITTYESTQAFSYEWKRGLSAISVNTPITVTSVPTYTITPAENNMFFTVTVTRSNYIGTVTSTPPLQVSLGGGGTGTTADPFIVDSVATLQKVGKNTDGWTLAACYKQVADIDLTGETWTPIGSSSTNSFQGSYDGGGHTIRGLELPDMQYSGLFGYVAGTSATSPAVIDNLKIELANVTYSSSSISYAGGLAGYTTNTEISRISVSVGNLYFTQLSTSCYFGGIVGCGNAGTVISDCFSDIAITIIVQSGRTAGGGIVGYLDSDGKIISCCSMVDITLQITTNSAAEAGGIVGWNSGSGYTVERCVVLGTNLNVSTTDMGSLRAGRIMVYSAGNDLNNVANISMQLYRAGTLITDFSNTSLHGIGVNGLTEAIYTRPYVNSTNDIMADSTGTITNLTTAGLGWNPAIWDFSGTHPKLR